MDPPYHRLQMVEGLLTHDTRVPGRFGDFEPGWSRYVPAGGMM